MKLSQRHLKIQRDALFEHRRIIMNRGAPIGTMVGERPLTPAVKNRLKEMMRLIRLFEDELKDSSSDDLWSLEQD